MTAKDTEAHDATPATEPLSLRLSEGLGPLLPKRAETPLGVHWLGGTPYMLTSAPAAGRVRRKDKGEL